MVSSLGLFLGLQPLAKLRLPLKGRPVNPLQLRILLIASVVGRGDTEEFEGLDVSGAGHMRSGAEVDEFTVPIKRNLFSLGDVSHSLDLEGLARLPKKLDGFLTSFHRALEDLILLGDSFHFSLDPLKVLRRKPMIRQVEVVIEALLGRRTDVEAGLGPDPEDGRRQHVGA